MADKFMVVKATQREISGIQIGDKQMTFGGKTNAFEVNDAGLAREIEARHGAKVSGDVVVVPHKVEREPGHRYTFTVPEMPWKRKDKSQ
jgi:hypothetical protein